MAMTRRAVGIVLLFHVFACGGGEEGGVLVTTVSEYGGSPVAGVRVQINDGVWRTTDETGHARFTDVVPPYDVVLAQVLESDGGSRLQDVWQLVDQTELSLTVPVDGSLATTHEGSVTGSVRNRSSEDRQVAVFGGRYPDTGASGIVEPDGTFQLAGFRWEGPTSQSFDLHALESTSGDLPAQYTGFGTATVTLIDNGEGATASAVISLASVDQTFVAGAVAVPDSFDPVLEPRISLTLPDGAETVLGGEAAITPGDFEIAVPSIDGARTRLVFSARGGGVDELAGPSASYERDLVLPAKDLDVRLPEATTLLQPAEGAVIDDTTVFRWETLGDVGRYGLRVSCDWDSGSISYRFVQTSDTEARLPDVPDVTLGAGATCRWSVAWFDGPAVGYETVTSPSEMRFSRSAERRAYLP